MESGLSVVLKQETSTCGVRELSDGFEHEKAEAQEEFSAWLSILLVCDSRCFVMRNECGILCSDWRAMRITSDQSAAKKWSTYFQLART